jgi:conserved hypothetical protein
VQLEDEIRELYGRLIDGWNANDAAAMSAPLANDAIVIGYDGSQMLGRDKVAGQLSQICAGHRTARYVTKVRSVRSFGSNSALLHAVVDMVPRGGAEITPDRNAIQTVVACRDDDGWCVQLFQTTPAQFHGRPELSEALTAELAELLPR